MKVYQRMTSVAVVCLLSCFVFVLGGIRASAYAATEAEIYVECIAVSDAPSHIYEVRIESENDDSPAPVSDILELTENGKGRFEIHLTEPGTFRYRIYEAAGDDPNIKYDSNIYEVTVFAENDEETGLTYTVTANIAGRNTKSESIEFRDIVLSDSVIVTTAVPKETASSGSETTSSATTSAGTTTTTSENEKNHITSFIDTVLTGDSFPAHALRLVMLYSFLAAISTFLFKRKHSEEEDENEK